MTDNAKSEVATGSCYPSGQGSPVDYSVPRVRIHVDEATRSGMEGRPRILSAEAIAEENARRHSNAQEPLLPEIRSQVLSTAAAAPVVGSTALIEAAQTVKATRDRLAQLNGRVAELREKSRDLETLKANLAAMRNRRARLLADALLAGKKADTAKIDKDTAAALIAFQKREDESLAVERALAILQADQESTQSALIKHEMSYKEVRDDYSEALGVADTLALRFHEAIVKARAALTQTAPHFREHLLELLHLKAEEALPAADVLRDSVTLRGKNDLAAADELASVSTPAPTCIGFIWADGSIRESPEPPPDAGLCCESTMNFNPDR